MTTESSRRVPFYKSPFVWAFIVGAVSLTAMRPIALAMRKAPPPLLTVGEWSLTDHNGKPFGSKELAGKVWMADFFFTSCPGPCLELTKNMQKLETRLVDEPNVVLVSFSVDPETDSPEKLRAYRERFGIKTDKWVFLTADSRDAMVKILVDQMKMHVGEKDTDATSVSEPTGAAKTDAEKAEAGLRDQVKLYDISHVARFALFDQNGDLRAMATTDSHGLTRLMQASELLIEKGPNP